MRDWKSYFVRSSELALLGLIGLVAGLAFLMATAALRVRAGDDPMPFLLPSLLPPLVAMLGFFALHAALSLRRVDFETILLPVVALIFILGLVLIWRLRDDEGVWQQLTRGYIPGVLVMLALVAYPRLVEYMRRFAIPISLVGLALPIFTALFGVTDETGARLALKLGPLPPIQTSEILKLALLIFLAWFVDREGEVAEGRAQTVLGWLRLPPLEYFLPGGLFVAMATLALVQMADFGAVLILAGIFVIMIYAGFQSRIFITLGVIGLIFAAIAGVGLAVAWEVPTMIQYRFIAFLDPWSDAMVTVNGVSTGITISQGPGYQIQQAIYAVIAGGITGTGLGFGSPGYVPLSHSDFIFAALVEELGAATAIAVIVLYAILILRILRVALLLPTGQVFERMLLVGIGAHFFIQVFIMIGGTLNLLPLTGVTVPFMSQGGVAVMVNLIEIGIVLALMQRMGAAPA
jgi:cell division protein FtsW (lipid II flippase)